MAVVVGVVGVVGVVVVVEAALMVDVVLTGPHPHLIIVRL